MVEGRPSATGRVVTMLMASPRNQGNDPALDESDRETCGEDGPPIERETHTGFLLRAQKKKRPWEQARMLPGPQSAANCFRLRTLWTTGVTDAARCGAPAPTTRAAVRHGHHRWLSWLTRLADVKMKSILTAERILRPSSSSSRGPFQGGAVLSGPRTRWPRRFS